MATQKITDKHAFYYEREVFPSQPLSGANTLTLRTQPLTDFMGFGVAITGSSCYLLSKMEPQKRTQILQDVYSPQGLNLSIGRLSIGASDYSPELYTYEDTRGQFSIAKDEAYIIPIIKEILAIKPNLYLYASPWSPPAWMKTGASLGGGFMRDEFLEEYADYTVNFIKAYQKHGISIRALTLQNEPMNHQYGQMPACVWHPETEANYAMILRRKLNENGLNVQIWLHDHDFGYVDRVTWLLDNVKGLTEAIDGVAFHYYGGSVEKTKIITQKHPNLKLHFTEGGPRLYDNYATDWCKWSTIIARTLACDYRSFTGWNLMLDETGGPNVGPFFCGGLITCNSITDELDYSGQYKALKHIAPYITPQSRIYPITDDDCDRMFSYPDERRRPTQGFLIENDNQKVLALCNGNEIKKQTQIYLDGKWWYIELLPDSLSTVIL